MASYQDPTLTKLTMTSAQSDFVIIIRTSSSRGEKTKKKGRAKKAEFRILVYSGPFLFSGTYSRPCLWRCRSRTKIYRRRDNVNRRGRNYLSWRIGSLRENGKISDRGRNISFMGYVTTDVSIQKLPLVCAKIRQEHPMWE